MLSVTITNDHWWSRLLATSLSVAGTQRAAPARDTQTPHVRPVRAFPKKAFRGALHTLHHSSHAVSHSRLSCARGGWLGAEGGAASARLSGFDRKGSRPGHGIATPSVWSVPRASAAGSPSSCVLHVLCCLHHL